VDPEPGNPGRDGSRKSQDTSIPAREETPMLATAIGRGNLEVLRYLLENGVDPRRRDSKGKSYVDIAREREGEFWEQEDMLKKAWDKAGGGRESRADRVRNPSSTHKGSSPKPKRQQTEKQYLPPHIAPTIPPLPH